MAKAGITKAENGIPKEQRSAEKIRGKLEQVQKSWKEGGIS
jgi:hypothetical protein